MATLSPQSVTLPLQPVTHHPQPRSTPTQPPARRNTQQATLTSSRPALRRAAVATLRHLAERDPATVLAQRLELALFATLDAETDPQASGAVWEGELTLCWLGGWDCRCCDAGRGN